MRKIFMMLIGLMLTAGCFGAKANAQDLIPSAMPIEDEYRQGIGKPVGTVVTARGEVVIIHKGETTGFRARKGLDLFEADTVVCLDESLAILETADGSRLSLAARTRLKLTRSVFSARDKDRSSFFNLAIGKARFWITKLADFKRSEVRVMTPTAILGVRGSDFIVTATQTITQVTTLEDTLLEVFNKLLPERPPVMMASFQRSMVETTTPPTLPEPITQQEAADIVTDVPNGQQDVESEKETASASAVADSTATETKTDTSVSESQIRVRTDTVIEPELAATASGTAAESNVTEAQTGTTSYRQATLVEETALIPPEEIPEAILTQTETPGIETFDSDRQEQISSIQETQDNSLKEVQEENVVTRLPDFPLPPK